MQNSTAMAKAKSLLPCGGMVVMLEPQCVNCVSFKMRIRFA